MYSHFIFGHTTIDNVAPGAADLFVCGADLVEKAIKAGKTIGLDNMISIPELEKKLMEVLNEDN